MIRLSTLPALASLAALAACGSGEGVGSGEEGAIFENAKGQELYQYWCAPCHGSSRHAPGTMALQTKYDGAVPALLEQRSDLGEEVLRQFIREGVSVMPAYRPTEISDADITAMAAYLQESAVRFDDEDRGN